MIRQAGLEQLLGDGFPAKDRWLSGYTENTRQQVGSCGEGGGRMDSPPAPRGSHTSSEMERLSLHVVSCLSNGFVTGQHPGQQRGPRENRSRLGPAGWAC